MPKQQFQVATKNADRISLNGLLHALNVLPLDLLGHSERPISYRKEALWKRMIKYTTQFLHIIKMIFGENYKCLA